MSLVTGPRKGTGTIVSVYQVDAGAGPFEELTTFDPLIAAAPAAPSALHSC
jgi:hypothetical protein